MKRALVYSVCAAGLLSMALAGGASARSVSAATGKQRVGTQANCFDTDFGTSAINSTCFADYEVPLTTDVAGSKNLTYTRRATTAGAQCRAVTSNRFATSISATAFDPIPVSGTFLSFTFAAINVPAQGVFFADCITNPGTNLLEFDYVP